MTSRLSLLALLLSVAGCDPIEQAAVGDSCASDGACKTGFCEQICREPGDDDDQDGLDNRTERERGSDPGHLDSDRDGLLDGAEGERDSDGDGRLDVIESALVDADLDCLPAQLDPNEDDPETDLVAIAHERCRRVGVCADAEVLARCDRVAVDGATIAEVVCDYGAIPRFDGAVEVRCDARDNDCDGQTDEDLGTIDSTGAVRGLGASCLGTGACAVREGVVECAPSGPELALCSVDAGGSEGPSVADDLDCDAIDNDCDGVTDEGVAWADPSSGALVGFGEPCAGQGACGLGQGVVECDALAYVGVCSTGPGGTADLSLSESCNAIDDDCDGVTDEDLTWLAPDGQPRVIGEACGVGACRGGEVVCGGAGTASCSTSALAGPETCDGQDDDCDGAVDELSELIDDCPSLGVCADLSVTDVACDGATLRCTFASPELIEADETRCNGLDDDCDGTTDEELTPLGGGELGTECYGTGVCEIALGSIVCAPDGIGTRCSVDTTDAPEVCNGLDDDCDGATDEAPTDTPMCADVGVCADYVNAGARCEGGAWRCAYVVDPGFELDETRCDGLDNDCDGGTDEALALVAEGTWQVIPGHSPPDRLVWPAADSPSGPLLFGGSERDADGDEPVLLGDLWRYDAAAVSWERLTATGGPSARAGHAVTWDPNHQLFVVHGGFTAITKVGDLGPDGAPVATMFVYDPAAASWSVVREAGDVPAPARRYHALAALGDGRLILHGGLPVGTDALGALNEPVVMLGTLSRSDGAWSCSWSTPVADDASWRYGHALVVVDDEVFALGGRALDGQPAAAIWRGVEGVASVIADVSVLGDFPAVIATAEGLVVGGDSLALLDLELGSSVPFALMQGAPPLARGGVLAQSDVGLLLIEGSNSEGEAGRRTFTLGLDPPRVTAVTPWNAPAPRVGASLVVDPTGTIRLLGGARRAGQGPLQDVWRWDADAREWRVEVAATTPQALDPGRPALWGAAATWNDDLDGALVWGEGVLWSYRDGAFTRRESLYAPPAGMAIFAGAGRLVVLGDGTLSLWGLTLDGASVTWTELASAPLDATLVAAGPADGATAAVVVQGGVGAVLLAEADGWSEAATLGPLEGGASAWDAAHARAYVLGAHVISTIDVVAGTVDTVALSGSGAPLRPALVWDPVRGALFGMGGVHTATASPDSGPATARTFLFDLGCE